MGDLVTGADTAFWVAWHRALESRRHDALFRDLLATRLAGERGEQVARRMNRGHANRGAWTTIVRTRLIDDLIVRSLAEGVDRVVNLATGYDTRPYRLPVPATLRWFEADAPAVLERKAELLKGERPGCSVERIAIDLTDPVTRLSVLEQSLRGASRALVLTEGLLVYLPEETVGSLARDLLAQTATRFWITDLASARTLRAMHFASRRLVADDARWRFAPTEGVAFFERLGWRLRDVQPLVREARRLNRLSWLMRLLAPLDRDPQRPWGAVLRCERC